MFIVRDSYTLPIHDHPRMMGILKIVSGSVQIQSYSKINSDSDEIVVQTEPIQEIDSLDPVTSVLSPEKSNYHEITAIDGSAAFFDILSPPYSDYSSEDEFKIHCSFYRKIIVDKDKQILKLEVIPTPDHYFCDVIKYNPPEFLLS